ncbi:MAG TPA: hypothetical protein VD969_21565 [Symbiobacteriaceae bacterium]|nr:hypothetical protein [Symbiobacteriaceae bacterium]
MSLSLWIDLVSAKLSGDRDARSALPEGPGPNPYFEYLARKGRRQASRLESRFWREDRRSKQRWIDAENQHHQAELELPLLVRQADAARERYELERARDQEDAVALNPPGRAYIPVVLSWLLLGLLIGGDAAISYTAFLTIGDVTPWLVGALSLMVVVAMVVIGHVIGDRFRHGTAGRWTKAGLVAVVIAISVVMTVFREQAQAEALAATRSVEIEAVTVTPGAPPAAAPQEPPGPPATWEFSPAMLPGFFMFLTVTMMGMVVPAILAYYVERRPRVLKVGQLNWITTRAEARLGAGRRRLCRANRRVAMTRTYRLTRYKEAQVRLDQSRDDIYWLMSAYADANMRRRGTQELHASLREKPPVPGRESLDELDWTYPEADRGATYWGRAPGAL